MPPFERRRFHERFVRATQREFDFLTLEGFERVGVRQKPNYSIVRFESEETFVGVLQRPRHDPSTFMVDLAVDRQEGRDERSDRGHGREELVAAVHPEWPRWRVLTLAGPSLFYASTPIEIDVAVARLARLLRIECVAFARGDPAAFDQLERNAEQEAREAVQRWEVEPLRLDAEQAFRRRAYDEAVALYEDVAMKLAELGEGLRRVDQARLTYARKQDRRGGSEAAS